MDQRTHERHHLEFEALKADLRRLVANEQHEHATWWPEIQARTAGLAARVDLLLAVNLALLSAFSGALVKLLFF
ncbi:MAG: hypothetical protein QN137_14350 [Armatimonadota bacterium]|nr:hypothetical protein [Armatimonadota bacterium]